MAAEAKLGEALPPLVVGIGNRLGERLDEVVETLRADLLESIPQLRGDAALHEMLVGSIRDNVAAGVQIYAGELDVAAASAPPRALEYARILAQRGVSSNALARSYRLSQRTLMNWAYRQFEEENADPTASFEAYRVLGEQNARYVDTVSEQVLAEYQAERGRWLAHDRTVRSDVLDRLLEGKLVDPMEAESVLAYRLRQFHLAAVITAERSGAAADVGVLESAAHHLAPAAGHAGAPLFWQRDSVTAWVWLPMGRAESAVDLERMVAALDDARLPVRVAVGGTSAGLPGFRASHHEALQALRVAAVAGGRAGRVVSYADPDVRVAALLAVDPEGTRRLVGRSLGRLADNTDVGRRLRETVRVFLDTQGSHIATAERLHLHKNTVKYRIAQATAERGRPLHADRLDLELALVACDWLPDLVF